MKAGFNRTSRYCVASVAILALFWLGTPVFAQEKPKTGSTTTTTVQPAPARTTTTTIRPATPGVAPSGAISPAPAAQPAGTPGSAAPAATAATAGTKPAKESISFSAVRVESILGKGKERTLLTGKARVLTGSLEIQADRIEITGENYASIACTGTVRVKDPEKGFTLTTESLVYDRPTQLSRVEGGGTLEDSQNGIVLRAEWIEFDQKNETILAQISVFISKEDFSARSEYALFDRRENTLLMTGVPTVKTRDATLSATTLSGTPGTEGMKLEGDVSGTILTGSSEEAAEDKIPAGETATTVKTPGP